jgi:hypothetical protein
VDKQRRIELAHSHGVTTQAEYEQVLDELARLRVKKVCLYGDRILNEPDAELATWLGFANIYRKYSRLLQLIRWCDREALRDCYLDLANYAIMGIQLLDRHDVTNLEKPDGTEN